jgi:hypothetical protein
MEGCKMNIQKVISKIEEYETQLSDIKNKPSKENEDLMYAIRGKIKSIIVEIYSEQEIKKLFQGIFSPFYFAPSEKFSFYNRDIESCLGGIQIIKDNYELGKFEKNKEIDVDSSVPNISIMNTNLNQNFNQMNLSITSFNDIYNFLNESNYLNKDEIKEIIKEIEDETKKDNIQKSKVKNLLEKLKQKGGDFLKQIPLSVLANLIAQGISGGL